MDALTAARGECYDGTMLQNDRSGRQKKNNVLKNKIRNRKEKEKHSYKILYFLSVMFFLFFQ